MRTLKTPKNRHECDNPANDHWGTKEERKQYRKMLKVIRHKTMMHIPLSEEEIEFNSKQICNEEKTTKKGEFICRRQKPNK